jgi:hypothetical protein
MRASFLDDVSAAEASRGAGTPCGAIASRGETCGRSRVISHEMSRDYALEYPVDDPDEDDEEDDDEDFDEDDEDEDDEEGDGEEPETWQVSDLTPSAKGWSLLDFRD